MPSKSLPEVASLSPQQPTQRILLRPEEAADAMGISPSALRRLVYGGQLARVFIGKAGWRIDPADIQRYIEANREYEQTIARFRDRKSA